MRLASLALTCLGVLLPRASGANEPLEAARSSFEALEYEQARHHLGAALNSGELTRAELIEVYKLRGQVVAILDGALAAEQDFRRLLAIEPLFEAPKTWSPVWLSPLAAARRWLRLNGALRIRHLPPPGPAPNLPITIDVQVETDPLAMVGTAQVHLMSGTDRSAPLRGLRLSLPPHLAGSTVKYYLEVLDRWGNVLVEIGSRERPLRIAIPASTLDLPTPHSGRLRPYAWSATALAGVALLSGVAFDAAAVSEFRSLEDSCAPNCSSSDLKGLHRRELICLAFLRFSGGIWCYGSAVVGAGLRSLARRTQGRRITAGHVMQNQDRRSAARRYSVTRHRLSSQRQTPSDSSSGERITICNTLVSA